MEKVAIYLRKSRADIEAEAKGEGETLAKHKKVLLEFAKDKKLNIIEIYQEIVSGESLIHRPKMLKLMEEVSNNCYDAVLCMDMDRLGRGDMQDQGFILKTFKQSKTKIITPRKIYDLDNEFDEEYSEFEAFMARKEFNIIKRRLQNGRIRSVKEGNYLGVRPPYGYQRIKKSDGWTLIPDPDQSLIVKMIFEWYTSDDPKIRLGSRNIAKKLNEIGIPTYFKTEWSGPVILDILKNPVYIGKVRWKTIERMKSSDPSKGLEIRTRPESERILADGKHEPIVLEEIFMKAQEIRENNQNPRWKPSTKLNNPLAGLIVCSKCGATLVLKYSTNTNSHPYLVCNKKGRGGYCNKSIRLEHVEKKILQSLYDWLQDYKLKIDPKDYAEEQNSTIEVYEQTILHLNQEMNTILKQKDRLHELLERGIYDEETFLERSHKISGELENARNSLIRAHDDLEIEKERKRAKLSVIPNIEHILDVYPNLSSMQERNMLLKKIIDQCIYTKEKHQKNDEFTLIIHPKI